MSLKMFCFLSGEISKLESVAFQTFFKLHKIIMYNYVMYYRDKQ